ncbi:MAG: energy transducer TonB [Candidatus Neomarinimicrobiota bacterium]
MSENPDLIDDLPTNIFDPEIYVSSTTIEAPVGPAPDFVAYDQAPQLIGGNAALASVIKYPPIAREAGIEGVVTVKIFIDKTGKVTKAYILKSTVPDTGLDEAALAAVYATNWKPARQREEPVGVWLAIPINFVLN